MNRRAAIDILVGLRPQLEARGIAHAGIFGSIARAQATASSDIDIVVSPSPGARLDLIDLGGIQSTLEESFPGYDIDIVVEPIKKPGLLAAIEKDRLVAF